MKKPPNGLTIPYQREFPWERFYDMSDEDDRRFFLWASHHNARPTMIELSNDMDVNESIELSSRAECDELIAKLIEARDSVFPE